MSTNYTDQAGELNEKPGNFDKLISYLKDELSLPETLEITQFPSGFSNLTYLVKSGKKEFVLRRPPNGVTIRSAHDMGREFRVLSLLKPIYPHVPTPLLFCDDHSILGVPFYIMERVSGVILRNKIPAGLELNTSLMQKISENAIDHLAILHGLPIEGGLAELGKPEGYILRQVEGWTQRYFKAETDKVAAMNLTAEWLKANMPNYSSASFIHNDYKYDNLVLDAGDVSQIVAVLDWEMATVGDPLMDLGTTLGYWTEAGDPAVLKYNLTWLPGNLSREEVVERYAAQTGRDVQKILFYYVFGLFKIGVIVQQIYARYKKGIAHDPRFAGLIHVLNACAENAQKAISLNRISHLYE